MATNEVTAASPARIPDIPRVVEAEHLFDRVASLRKRIARRAFEHFLDRGGEPGRELEDWIAAEREILRSLPVDVETLDRHVVVRTQTPGFKESELFVSVEPDRVAIGGWREEASERDVEGLQSRESTSEEIFREVALPCAVETSDPEIVYKDGELTITLARAVPDYEPVDV